MNFPIIDFDKEINLTLNDNNYVFNGNHITKMFWDIFKKNSRPSFIKKREILFLFSKKGDWSIKDKNFIFDFLGMDFSNKDLVEYFNKKDFRIIAGFEEQMKSIALLEMLFEHRIDMLVLFNSDNMELFDELRGMINAPVFMADFFTDNQYVYKCKYNRFHLKGINETYKEEKNLESFQLNGKKYYFIRDSKKCKCRKDNVLIDSIFYSKEKIIFLRSTRNEITTFSIFDLKRRIERNSLNIIQTDISVNEDAVNINLFIYDESLLNNIGDKIENWFQKFTKQEQLFDYELRLNISVFGKEAI